MWKSVCLPVCVCASSVDVPCSESRWSVRCSGSRGKHEFSCCVDAGDWTLVLSCLILLTQLSPFHCWPLSFSTCVPYLAVSLSFDFAFLAVAKNPTCHFERFVLLCCQISLLNRAEEVIQSVRRLRKPEAWIWIQTPRRTPGMAGSMCLSLLALWGWRQENPWHSLAS